MSRDINSVPPPAGHASEAARPSAASEARALSAIAVPLAVVSLSEIAMGLTDTILLGGVGEKAVAAGGLGGTLFFTVGATLQGALMAAGVLTAQARGARQEGVAARFYATALFLGLLLAIPAFLLFSMIEPILLWFGEDAGLAHDVGVYLGILRFASPAFVAGIGLMRAMLPAIGQERMLLRVTPAMAVANGLLNYVLINGWGPVPGLGLRGSAMATTITLWCTVFCLFGVLHGSRRRRVLISPFQPDRRMLGPMLRVGMPIAATIAAETSMFMVASLVAGLFGASSLAAHQIVLSIGTFTFMIPLSIGQAANVRTGLATGARDPVAVRRAGFVAIAMAASVMAAIGVVLLVLPGPIIHAFLDPHDPGNKGAIAIATGLIAVLALFQLVDGTQAAAIGALRGMGDTRVPMAIALIGYWLIGPALGWFMAFHQGHGALGVWIGLAGGLASVALMMTLRFDHATRRALRPSR